MATVEKDFRQYVVDDYNKSSFTKKENLAEMKVDYEKHFIEVTCKKPTRYFVHNFYPRSEDYKHMIARVFDKIQVDGKKVTIYADEVDEGYAKQWLQIEDV